MAKGDGKTLESLYIELGLDISKLQADILAADKTVTENLGRLNREKNTIKLRVEADIAALDRVKDATQILEIQERGLNRQLTLSRDKLAILEAAYKQVANNKNSTALAVQRAEQAFLKEKIAIEQLEQKLKSLSTQKISLDTTHLQDNIARLNARIQHVKIQADIDVSKLQGANAAFEAQKIHIAAVTNELELQRQKLIQIRAELYQSARQHGSDSFQTLNIKSNVLQQIHEINQLEIKLKDLSTQKLFLDTSALQESLTKLNAKIQHVRITAELDTSKLQSAGNVFDAQKVHVAALTQELDLQRQKLVELQNVLRQSTKLSGNDSNQTLNIKSNVLQQMQEINRLETKLKELQNTDVTLKIKADSFRQVEQSVQENISRLNAKIQNIKLKAEIDTSKLKDAGNAFDAQKVQVAALTRELELQRQKLVQLREMMYQSAKQSGSDSNQTLNIKSNVLQQIRDINQLEAKLKELKNTDVNLRIRADSIKQAELQIHDNIARLNAQIEHIRVKTDIDVSKFGAASSEFDKVKAHVAGLNRELDLQNQKLAELKRALSTSITTNGLNNVKTINLQTDIQRQIQAIDQLKAKINELNKIEPPKNNGLLSGYLNIKGNVTDKLNSMALAFSSLRGATSSADVAIISVLGVIDAIPKPIAAATAALVGVPILFKAIENSIVDMTRAAAASGDAVYVMSRGMQMSIKDAATFSTNAKVAGAQVNDLAMAVKNVQRQVARGGEDSRAAEWLKRYGESAYDASGNLKDLNQMTFALSGALKRAQADGKGAEFVLNVFRNVSADAITAIEDWADVNEQASKIVKAGLANPKLAHEVQGNLNALNVQSAQLGTSFTNALLPAANEIVPRMTDRLGKMTSLIKDNKDVILAFGKDFAEGWGAVEDTIDRVVDGVSVLAEYARKNRVVRNTATKSVVERYKDDTSIQSTKDILEREIAAGGYSDEDISKLRARNDLYLKELKRTEQDRKAILAERRKDFAELNKPILDKYKYDDSIKTANDLLNRLTDEEKQVITQTDSTFGSLLERVAALNLELQNIRKTAEQAKNEVKNFKSVAEDFSTAGQERRKLGEDEIDQLRQFRKYEENAAAIMDKLKLNDYEYQKSELQRWIQEQLPRETEQSLEKYQAVMKEAAARNAQIEQEKENRLAEIRKGITEVDLTELEKRKRAIEDEKQSWIQAGMEKLEAEELAQKKFATHMQQVQKEFSNAVQAVYQTELEKRLAQIEKERQAWIDKCGDEVEATKLAEQEKADAQRNAAMQVIKQQAKEYEAYQQGGLAGLQAYKMADLAKSGVNLEYLNMTPQQLQQFQRANQLAEKGLMPQFMTDTDRAFYQQQMQQSYQRLKDEYDKDNYAIVNGQKMTMSEALGGVPIKISLDKDTQITLPPEAYAITDGQKTTMNEALNKPTQAMMRDYETDNKGNLAAMSETQIAMPSVFDEAMKSFSEMPPVIQGTTESLNAVPPIVQAAAESLNELPIAVQGITENLAAVDIPQFADISQAAQEVVVKLDDFKTALSNFSFPQKDSAQRTPVNVNVTVQIQEAHAWDSEHIQELADKCADKMQPEIIRAIGGDSNSY